MPRPLYARINPDALSNNLEVVRRLAPGARVWSVVKANAYGHGIERVHDALHASDGFALLDLDEAVRLRNTGWRGPILLLEGFFCPDDLQLIDRYQLTSVVHNEEQLRLLEATARMRPLDVLLKLNSGMNRLGFTSTAYREAWQRLRALPWIGAITHMSHFSDADTARGIAHQIAHFDRTRGDLPGPSSLANSAAILWHPDAHREWVRPGVMLYGASPSGRYADIVDTGLRQVMSLHSELIAIQTLAPGDCVGYGSGYTAHRALRVGIVACGYADGYPRHACGAGEHRTPVLVDNRLTHLAGRVSMDMIAVELPDDLDVHVGTPVTLWGDDLPIDDVAESAQTIGYELMCALAPRVPVR